VTPADSMNPPHSPEMRLAQALLAEDLAGALAVLSSAGSNATGARLSAALLDKALGWAACHGHVAALALIIPLLDHKTPRSAWPLSAAALHGNAEALAFLIPFFDPKDQQSDPLRRAAEHGKIDCLRLLLPLSDPAAADSRALRLAAANGQGACVDLLIASSDPKAKNSEALRSAAVLGSRACVFALLPVSDPRAVGPDGRDAASCARSHGHEALADAIAFWVAQREADDLASCAPAAGRGSRHGL
jgi:hypothetical protein